MFNEFEQKNIVLLWFAYDILGELQELYTVCKRKKIDRKWSTKDKCRNIFFCDLTTMLNRRLLYTSRSDYEYKH